MRQLRRRQGRVMSDLVDKIVRIACNKIAQEIREIRYPNDSEPVCEYPDCHCSELPEPRRIIEAAHEVIVESSYDEMILNFLNRKYVQRSDERQKAMGLQYTTAETHDLAREINSYIRAMIAALRKEIA